MSVVEKKKKKAEPVAVPEPVAAVDVVVVKKKKKRPAESEAVDDVVVMKKKKPAEPVVVVSELVVTKKPEPDAVKRKKKKAAAAETEEIAAAAAAVEEEEVPEAKKRLILFIVSIDVCNDEGGEADEYAGDVPPGSTLALPAQPPTGAEYMAERRAKYVDMWLTTFGGGAGGAAVPERTRLVARDMEIGVYNATVADAARRNELVYATSRVFWELYSNRNRTVWRNLQNSAALRTALLSGAALPSSIEGMHVIEFNTARWHREVQLKDKRLQEAVASRMVANTSEYTCQRCKSTMCYYSSIQLRGADEAETIFIDCINCGFHWSD